IEKIRDLSTQIKIPAATDGITAKIKSPIRSGAVAERPRRGLDLLALLSSNASPGWEFRLPI
ncbi:MAG: hypothetical protein ACLQF1_09640, partial [Methyloceanibacter sp.]